MALLLPPPPPPFPTRFSQKDAEPSEASSSATASWPDEAKRAGEGASKIEGGAQVAWELKTEGEEHVERLENKLSRLRSQPQLPSPALDDSGYVSNPANGIEMSGQDDFDEGVVVEDDGRAAGDEEEEGQALLSSVGATGAVEQPSRGESRRIRDGGDKASHDEDADSSENGEGEERFSRSRLPFRMSAGVPRNEGKRASITFNNSVRIGGRGGNRSHRHRLSDAFFPSAAPTERTSLLAPQPRPISAPSSLLVASVTASSSPSRSTSPGPSRPRRTGSGLTSSSPSRSTSPRPPSTRRPSNASSSQLSSSFIPRHPSYGYSTSPASYGGVNSRSSSPCSSVYAPLHPPSQHCPNPMYVRPVGGLRVPRRGRNGSVLSFQEFLRAGGRPPVFEDEDDSDEEEDEEIGWREERLDYRDLVEAQRVKKARWEARKRAKEQARRQRREGLDAFSRPAQEGGGGGFWDRLAHLLALGIAGSNSSGRTAPPNVRVLAAPPTPEQRRGKSPARPSPLRRPPSSVVVAHHQAGDLSSSSAAHDEHFSPPRRPPPRRRAPPPLSSSSTKSESDVRFGPAPRRYFRLSWLKHKLGEVVKAATRAWEVAKKKWGRAAHSATREEGYAEV
ncbi:hypothetical protein JCM8547_003989 [Rhodosporidiobolus lusitaniae]